MRQLKYRDVPLKENLWQEVFWTHFHFPEIDTSSDQEAARCSKQFVEHIKNTTNPKLSSFADNAEGVDPPQSVYPICNLFSDF